MPCYHALSYPSNFAHAKNTFILIVQCVPAFFRMLFYFFSSPLKYSKVPENTRRVLGKIRASTSILVGGKMRSIIFEQQPLFSASGRASSTSKDRTHHYQCVRGIGASSESREAGRPRFIYISAFRESVHGAVRSKRKQMAIRHRANILFWLRGKKKR